MPCFQCLEPEAWVGGCLIFHLSRQMAKKAQGKEGAWAQPFKLSVHLSAVLGKLWGSI